MRKIILMWPIVEDMAHVQNLVNYTNGYIGKNKTEHHIELIRFGKTGAAIIGTDYSEENWQSMCKEVEALNAK